MRQVHFLQLFASEMAVHGAANQSPCLVFLSGGCRREGQSYLSPQKKRRKGVEPNSGKLLHSVVGGLLSRISQVTRTHSENKLSESNSNFARQQLMLILCRFHLYQEDEIIPTFQAPENSHYSEMRGCTEKCLVQTWNTANTWYGLVFLVDWSSSLHIVLCILQYEKGIVMHF